MSIFFKIFLLFFLLLSARSDGDAQDNQERQAGLRRHHPAPDGEEPRSALHSLTASLLFWTTGNIHSYYTVSHLLRFQSLSRKSNIGSSSCDLWQVIFYLLFFLLHSFLERLCPPPSEPPVKVVRLSVLRVCGNKHHQVGNTMPDG